jgi:hypothetical protein
MSPRISRRLALLAPALLGGLLWLGLPGAAEAGGRKHGHHDRGGHHDRHDKHHGKHFSGHHGRHHGYERGWRDHGHHSSWYGGHRRHHHGHYYYPAPVAVSVYLDGPCGYAYESWDHFSHHLHHHHGVAFVDLPGLLVETSFGFAFHR